MNVVTRRFLTAVTVLLSLLIIAHAGWNLIAGHELRRTVKTLQAKGYPFAIKDVIPVYEGEKADASIYLKKAFAIIENGQEGKQNSQIFIAKLLLLHDGSNPDADPNFSLPRMSADAKRDIRQFIYKEPMSEIYKFLEEASKRPSCRFDLDLSLGLAAVPREVLNLKNAIKLLLLKSWLDTDAGRHKEAINTIAIAIRLCSFLEEYPTITAQLQRVSAAGITLGRLSKALETSGPNGLSKNDLTELELAIGLLRDTDRSGISRAIDCERILNSAWLGKEFLQGAKISKDGKTFHSQSKRYYSYLFKPILKTDIKAYIEIMAQGRDYAKKPRSERLQMRDPAKKIAGYHRLALSLAPSFSKLAERMDMFDTAVEQARASIAVYRYRLENKHYPERWDLLGIPEIKDPFGDYLRYKRIGEDFAIVSAGFNGIYEEGAGDDIVWPDKR